MNNAGEHDRERLTQITTPKQMERKSADVERCTVLSCTTGFDVAVASAAADLPYVLIQCEIVVSLSRYIGVKNASQVVA